MKTKTWKQYALGILLTQSIGALSGWLSKDGMKIFSASISLPPLSPLVSLKEIPLAFSAFRDMAVLDGASELFATVTGLEGALSSFLPVIGAVTLAVGGLVTYLALQYNSFDGYYERATKDREALESTRKSISETTASIEENEKKLKKPIKQVRFE